jgi:threonine aldolase
LADDLSLKSDATRKTLDLRSDTVTRPGQAMRAAMAAAPVGDDVYGEDPTVNRLQEVAAERLGMETALFVPSGTMANQVALAAQTRPGDVVLAGQGAHLLLYESGAPSALWGVSIQTVGTGGLVTAEDVARAIPPDDPHCAPASLLALENTHNRAGGRVFPFDQLRSACETARENGLAVHLDGARLWNAVVATGIPAERWAGCFDTVSFCLSKGLGAPIGSLIASKAALAPRLQRARKQLGGGMRQAGIVAAAGLYALEYQVERLAEDHANAAALAEGLSKRGFEVSPPPETNMVLFRVRDTPGFLRETRSRGLLINPVEEGTFRAVTHLDFDRRDVDDALARIDEVAAAGVA